VFEQLKQSLRDALSRAPSSPEGRAALALMRQGIIDAKVAVAEMRDGVGRTRERLAAERAALETVRRRGRLASGINDAETVRIAAQYEQRHAERVGVLERKLAAQEAEVALAEQELAEMTAQLKAAAAGVPLAGATSGATSGTTPGADPGAAPGGQSADEGEQLKQSIDRSARQSRAEQQLAELKRRMGK
jgi:hypothetical protein